MQVIDIGREFAKVPFGRTQASGPHNAARFRDEFLAPAVARNDKIRVVFDSAIGLGSSFLEECFGGLVAQLKWTESEFARRVEIVSENDPTLIDDVTDYVRRHAAKP